MPTPQTQTADNHLLLRVIAAIAVGITGSVAVSHTAAYQLRSASSELAHRLAPYDGRITALAAAFRSGPNASLRDRRDGNELARLALRQDATAVVAASTLGLNAQVLDKTPQARRLFGYAEFLSRSEIQTQLWAIEDSVGRGDVTGALRHYDIAMRTTPSLSQMLFPVLTSASTDPQIRVPLVKTLAANPSWGQSFITHVAANSSDPQSTAQLLMDLRHAGVFVPDVAQASVINSMIGAGFSNEAWNYYASVRPHVDRRMSRDPRFMGSMEAPSPFDWIVNEGGSVSVSIQRGDRYGVLDFTAPTMVGGSLLQQIQLLPAGHYELIGHSVGIEQAVAARPYWMLTCRGGKEIGRVPVSNSSNADGKFFGVLEVPQGCPVQILSLNAKPSDEISGVSGQIDFVQLRPAK